MNTVKRTTECLVSITEPTVERTDSEEGKGNKPVPLILSVCAAGCLVMPVELRLNVSTERVLRGGGS